MGLLFSNLTAHRLIGVFFIMVSAASFGAMPIFANIAYESGATPISVLFLRFTIAAVMMIPWLLMRGMPIPRGKSLLILVGMGGLGYAGQSFSYFTALTLTPAGTVAILLYLYPALVTGLSLIFLKHVISTREVAALVFALTGTVLVIGFEMGGQPLGIILGVLAAFIYAGYITVGAIATQNTGAFSSSTVIITAASLVYGMLIVSNGIHFPTTLVGWGAVSAIALISTVIAIVAFFEGLKRIGPVHASMFSTVEPVVTVALACALLGETLTVPKMLGGAMVLTAGVLLTNR